MTGFRAPLDISGYIQKLGGDGTRALGYRKTRQRMAVEREYAQERQDERTESPWAVGHPENIVASSTGVLEATPTVVWDVNGYYRSLGFRFPYRGITRAMLREAYHETGGESSVHATYALRQLLDGPTRWEYDRMPLGERFYDDLVSEEIKLGAKKEAGRRQAAGGSASAEDVLDEWGLRTVPEDRDGPPQIPSPRPPVDTWGYYLWRGAYGYDQTALWEWRELLLSQFAKNGVVCRFAVGYTRRQPHSWVVADVRGVPVFFLNEDTVPTGEMAAQAVAWTSREGIA